jgi:hypothetical protein
MATKKGGKKAGKKSGGYKKSKKGGGAKKAAKKGPYSGFGSAYKTSSD